MLAVVFPWRPQPARVQGFEFTWDWWRRRFPYAKLTTVDTGHEPFNLAACRNLAVKWAEANDCDVVVIPDADAVPADVAAVLDAIRDAQFGGFHLPFNEQRYLTEEETLGLFAGVEPPVEGSHGNGALYVTTPSTWWACGGQDERFSGWGGDDDQIVAAAQTLVGLKRHTGVVWSLWHADEFRDIGSERHRPNAELSARYWRALGKRDEMLKLIAER